MFRLILDNHRLWLAVLMRPVCANRFRFRGPHAKPDSATCQLPMPHAVQSEDDIASVDLYMASPPLATLLVPAYAIRSMVPVPERNATLHLSGCVKWCFSSFDPPV
ncbi:MAG: hypothetical protein AAGI50_00955 [Pseudomonadota bacterium]